LEESRWIAFAQGEIALLMVMTLDNDNEDVQTCPVCSSIYTKTTAYACLNALLFLPDQMSNSNRTHEINAIICHLYVKNSRPFRALISAHHETLIILVVSRRLNLCHESFAYISINNATNSEGRL